MGIIIVSKFWVPKKHKAITLWPFIVVKNKELKNDLCLLNHEKIHIQQQVELLVIPFYIWYGLEFLINILKGYSKYESYRNISFEKEAYGKELDFNYLNNRRFWNFLIYFGKKVNDPKQGKK